MISKRFPENILYRHYFWFPNWIKMSSTYILLTILSIESTLSWWDLIKKRCWAIWLVDSKLSDLHDVWLDGSGKIEVWRGKKSFDSLSQAEKNPVKLQTFGTGGTWFLWKILTLISELFECNEQNRHIKATTKYRKLPFRAWQRCKMTSSTELWHFWNFKVHSSRYNSHSSWNLHCKTRPKIWWAKVLGNAMQLKLGI